MTRLLITLWVTLFALIIIVPVQLSAFTLQNSFTTDNSGAIDQTERASVTFADVNGDGYADLVGSTDDGTDRNSNGTLGQVYCFDIHNNTMLWEYEPSPKTVVYSTPAVGDVTGDGYPEIVFGVGDGIGANTLHGRLYVLDRFGNYLWSYNTRDFDSNGYRDGVYASPALGDIDRDGIRDIVVATFDQYVYAFRYNTSSSSFQKMWEFHAGDTMWSSAALANIDNDPYLEVIVGIPIHWEDSMANTDFYFDIRYDGGMILVLNHNGTMHSDFLNRPGDPEKPKTYTSQTIRSSPAVADLDGDGDFEIVHATSAYRGGFHGRCGPSSITPIPEPRIYAWSSNGNLFWQSPYLGALPANFCDSSVISDSECSPAVADMDGDGKMEVVVTQRATSGGAKVFVINGENGQFQDSTVLTDHSGNTTTVGIRSSPIIANIDADANLEAMVGFRNDVMILSHTGYNSGNAANADSYINFLGQITYNTPAMWDCDCDGKIEIGIGNKVGPNDGRFSVFDSDVTGVPLCGTTARSWPMFRQNQYHTGVLDYTPPATVNNLGVEKLRDDSVRLYWNAPGNNGNVGCAFSYEIRYMSGSFDWNTATPVNNVQLPSVAGSSEEIIITGLNSKTNYYFAIRTADDSGNWSPLSIVSVDFVVPVLDWLGVFFLMTILSWTLFRFTVKSEHRAK